MDADRSRRLHDCILRLNTALGSLSCVAYREPAPRSDDEREQHALVNVAFFSCQEALAIARSLLEREQDIQETKDTHR